jgi:hypothetical protein
VDFDIPAGFPTHRHVTAQESLENWGPLHVFDANGIQIKDTTSICVSSGEVIVHVCNSNHELLRNPWEPSRLLEVPIMYPAPLSVRPVTYDFP